MFGHGQVHALADQDTINRHRPILRSSPPAVAHSVLHCFRGSVCFSHMRSLPLHHLPDAPARPPSQISALPLPDVLPTDLLWHGRLDPLPPKKNEKRGCLTH